MTRIRYTNDDGTMRELQDVFDDQDREMEKVLLWAFVGAVIVAICLFSFVLLVLI